MRVGPQITVAGNPPVKFATFREVENESGGVATFRLFLTRVFLNDIFSIGMIPITAELVFTIFYIFKRSFGHSVAGALAVLVIADVRGSFVCCR